MPVVDKNSGPSEEVGIDLPAGRRVGADQAHVGPGPDGVGGDHRRG